MIVSQMQCSVNEEINGAEDDDKLRTIECLRGRLQAERVASKASKEEAENLSKRLDELEKKLSEETKSRNRAEKRLHYALKKLESLRVLNGNSRQEIVESSASSSSSHCLLDHQGSIGCDSGFSDKDFSKCDSGQEMVKEMQMCNGSEKDLSDENSSSSANLLFDQVDDQQGEKSRTLAGNVKSDPDDETRSNDSGDQKGNHQELAIVVFRESRSDDGKQEGASTNEDDEHVVDNTLALVPITSPFDSTIKPRNRNNVQDALVALRKVKEQLLYTMQRRASFHSRREITTCQTSIYGASFRCH